MRISEEEVIYGLKVVNVQKAEYSGKYKIRIQFDDHTSKEVDFEDFLTKSDHPGIKKYLDKKLFTTFKVENGNLNWNDFDLIFPVSDLYKGKIE